MILALQIELYVTGSNNDGKLGIDLNETSIKYFTAKATENFTTISLGAKHVVAITTNGELYGWGSASDYKLMKKNGTETHPVLIDYFSHKNVTDASAGDNHTLVIAEGVVYAFGSNLEKYLGNDSEYMPAIPKISGVPQKVLAVGYASYVLTTDGDVYFFGLCYQYICGMESGNYAVPTRMPLPAKAYDIFASSSSFLFLANNGSVFMIGDNSLKRYCLPENQYASFQLLNLTGNANKIVSGRSHSLISTSAGVYGCGDSSNQYLGDRLKCETPCLLRAEHTDISATDYASLIVAGNVVYVSGYQYFGETGRPYDLVDFQPVFNATNLTYIASFHDYSMAYQSIPQKKQASHPLSWWAITLIVVFSVGILAVILYFLYAIFIKKEKIFVSPKYRAEEKGAKIAMEMDYW